MSILDDHIKKNSQIIDKTGEGVDRDIDKPKFQSDKGPSAEQERFRALGTAGHGTSRAVTQEDLKDAFIIENFAEKMKPKLTRCVKPLGPPLSLHVGVSSGIHPVPTQPYYQRKLRIKGRDASDMSIEEIKHLVQESLKAVEDMPNIAFVDYRSRVFSPQPIEEDKYFWDAALEELRQDQEMIDEYDEEQRELLIKKQTVYGNPKQKLEFIRLHMAMHDIGFNDLPKAFQEYMEKGDNT